MPIEIKEVVIRTVVDPSAGGGGGAAGPQGGGSSGSQPQQDLVDTILEILEEKEER